MTARKVLARPALLAGTFMATQALATVYGQKIPHSSPLPAGQKISGNEIQLSFTHTDGGLLAKAGELKDFAIADADHKWVWTQSRIVGNQVVGSSPAVKSPVAAIKIACGLRLKNAFATVAYQSD